MLWVINFSEKNAPVKWLAEELVGLDCQNVQRYI